MTRCLITTYQDSERSAAEGQPLLSTRLLPDGVTPSLVKCLAKVFLPSMLTCAAFKLVQDICLFVSPTILK